MLLFCDEIHLKTKIPTLPPSKYYGRGERTLEYDMLMKGNIKSLNNTVLCFKVSIFWCHNI